MARINEIIKRWKSLDVEVTARQAFNDTKENYADLNAEQMFSGVTKDDGPITLDGRKGYARKTYEIKTEKGQPTDRITLRDTGAFQRGIYAKIEGTTITISSTDSKADEIQERTGKEIFGLNEGNIKEFSLGVYREAYMERVNKVLGRK